MTLGSSHSRAFNKLNSTLFTLLATLALVATIAAPAAAQPPAIGLTQVGTPIWRPGDFQMFTAPASPFPDAFFDTLDSMLPLEGPGTTTYTPHPGPYDTELSTNAAAAGFVTASMSSPAARLRSTQTASIS